MEGKIAGKVIPRMKDEVNPMRSGQSVFDFDDGSLGEDAGKAVLVLDMRSEALAVRLCTRNFVHPQYVVCSPANLACCGD